MERAVLLALMLVFCAPAAAQEPTLQEKVDQLSKQLEELRKRVSILEGEKEKLGVENAGLKKELDNLEIFSRKAAETITRLRQALAESPRTGDGPAPARGEERPTGDAPAPKDGPVAPVRGKVLHANAELGFLIIDLGEDHGVKEGWTFDVVRIVRDREAGDKTESIGKAAFEKYVEKARGTNSKLKITEGDATKMKYGDIVVAFRKMDPVAEKPEGPAAPKGAERKYKIFGLSGGNFMIDVGSQDGLKQSDRVYVHRDKRTIAQLRLDSVEKDYSVGKIIDGTKLAEPAQGDEILLKELKTSLIAKVKRIDDKSGIYIEIGSRQSARVGMIFEVRRQGRPLGKIKLKTVDAWHSVAEPIGDLKPEDVQIDDFVESVD